MFFIHETQAIAVGKHGSSSHIKRFPFYFLHIAYVFTHSLGGVKRSDVARPTIKEIIGKTTVEGFFKMWSKRIFNFSIR